MQIVDCIQGTEEWHRARMGVPTASKFSVLLGINKDAKAKLTRQKYLRELAGEILTGVPAENYTNGHMERGHAQEDDARRLYAFTRECEPQRVGFIMSGRAGASPDSLIDQDGGLEIKTALAHIQIERLERDEFPGEYRAQVQGNIWIAERAYWDFVSYCPGLPLLVCRVEREDGYIATLAGAVKQFNEELDELVERIRRYGQPQKEAA